MIIFFITYICLRWRTQESFFDMPQIVVCTYKYTHMYYRVIGDKCGELNNSTPWMPKKKHCQYKLWSKVVVILQQLLIFLLRIAHKK